MPESVGSSRVSVVVNTNGRLIGLTKLLEALRRQWFGDFEVCVVCGPAPDGTRAFVAEQAAAGILKGAVCDEANLSKSRNIGIALAAGSRVAFIDDDALPEPVWLEQLLRGFDDPAVGAVSGLVFEPNGRDHQFRYSTCDRFGNSTHGLARPGDVGAFPGSAHFPHVMGTNAVFAREALVAVGGYDEEYDYYLDEADLCCRLIDAGHLIRQRADAPVHHKFLAGTVRDGEGIAVRHLPILKNRLYFALINGRDHAPLPTILAEFLSYADTHRRQIADHVAAGRLHHAAIEAFETDLERACEIGLTRGLTGRRRPTSVRLDRPPAFLAFPTDRRPAGGVRHRVVVATETEMWGDDFVRLSGLVKRLGTDGAFVRVLVGCRSRGFENAGVDLVEGMWVQRHMVPTQADPAATESADALADAAAEIARIGRYDPIDEVERASAHRLG